MYGGDFQEYVSNQEANGLAGFPVTDQLSMNGGTVQYFREGCGGTTHCAGIYFSASTVSRLVFGGDFKDYQGLGEANGPLAFPITDQLNISGGTIQYFTANHGCGSPGPYGSDGAIYWTGSAGFQVYGCIYGTYMTYSGPGGALGYPISSEYTNPAGYRENRFENGTITWVNGQGQVCLGSTC